MTVMYSFCFWFSVRLGSIIVGLCCLAQSVIALVACGLGMSDLGRTSSHINYWLQTNDMMITEVFFVAIRDDPETYLTAFIYTLSVYLGSCILLIYGAFKCNIYFMSPFMILDFIRLIIMSAALVIMVLLVKTNTVDLGYVIGASVLSGFVLIYLWYQWFCTVALWQIIKEIEKLNKSNNQIVQQPSTQMEHQYRKGNYENKIAVFPDFYHGRNDFKFRGMPRPQM